ncbi:hypothetical protein K469DRAFT_716531, partial [Zopfia rhizophila CBS 207.26]
MIWTLLRMSEDGGRLDHDPLARLYQECCDRSSLHVSLRNALKTSGSTSWVRSVKDYF